MTIYKRIKRIISAIVLIPFIVSMVLPVPFVHAQSVPASPVGGLNLPTPGTMITSSPSYVPVLMKGVTLDLSNPFSFDFIVHPGDTGLQGEQLLSESTKLIKYFMAALTIPEDEMWVNLSPYEKNRIIPNGFGDTEMGRDLLAQDYMLKQLTASLMYPEKELGNKFWNRVYKKAQEKYGTTELPMNTFNKVWIIPDRAEIYENGTTAVITEMRLKVLLEEDYLALESNLGTTKHGLGDISEEDLKDVSGVSSEVIREIIISEIEREVNEGKTFANLRQISGAVILATWYKNKVQGSILDRIYIDQGKTKGIDIQDKNINQKIYNQYVKAFKKGVYDFIKEDYDEATQQVIPRKYFSGGAEQNWSDETVTRRDDEAQDRASDALQGSFHAPANFVSNSGDVAMLSEDAVKLFGNPVNEPLSEEIAKLPADSRSVREVIVSGEHRGRVARSIEQERLELEQGVGVSDLEPQIAWAVQILNIKGYGTNNSGYDTESEYGFDNFEAARRSTTVASHSIDSLIRVLTPEEIEIVESVEGAIYDPFKNGILVNSEGKTLAQVKEIFDEVARRLPDVGQPSRERFSMFETALTKRNQHFVMKRELRYGDQEYSTKREWYLNRFVRYLKQNKDSKISDVVSLGQEIVHQEEEPGGVSEIFIRRQFRDAIVEGKILTLEIYDLEDDDYDILSMVKEVLAQRGKTVRFNGEKLTVHPEFRLVFFLNEQETTELEANVSSELMQFDFPQHGIDIGEEVMHRLNNSIDYDSFSERPQEDIDAMRSASFDPTLREVVNRYHRGKAEKAELKQALETAFLKRFKTEEFKTKFQAVLDSAMLGVNDPDVGGIDLNPNNINIQTSRNGAKIIFPDNIQYRNIRPVDGLIPVIFNITPITNIPMLLGESTETSQQQFSSI